MKSGFGRVEKVEYSTSTVVVESQHVMSLCVLVPQTNPLLQMYSYLHLYILCTYSSFLLFGALPFLRIWVIYVSNERGKVDPGANVTPQVFCGGFRSRFSSLSSPSAMYGLIYMTLNTGMDRYTSIYTSPNSN